MKIGGKKIDSRPASQMIVFPREGTEIAIRANAVMSRDEFDKLVPTPQPPKMRVRGNNLVDNPEDPRYILALRQHGTKYINWLIIQSLTGVDKETKEDSPIEWEKVVKADHNTWHLWEEELKEAGFSDMERKRLNNLVISVNSLSDASLDEARNSFLRPQEREPELLSYPNSEQNATLSGEAVNGSASSLQESEEVGTSSIKPTGG